MTLMTDEQGTDKNQAIIDQYRDWLIPTTIFSSISASVFLLIITTKGPVGFYTAALISSFISLGLYIIALFYSFMKLELTTIDRHKARQDGILYALNMIATLFLLISLSFVSFAHSLFFGICTSILVLLFIFTFFWILIYGESRSIKLTGPRLEPAQPGR